jgi:hypothetical protein
MCGITGIWNLNNKAISKPMLERFTDSLSHRGPDGNGFYIDADANLGLGHRRLAIIDTTNTGRQPMSYARGRYRITYNGEIYNFLELHQELGEDNFVTNSDAEKSNIPNDERIRFTHGSVSDDKILATIHDKYDYIFHLSKYHGNQSSIADPLADHDNNTLTSLKLLERVKDFNQFKKWVYSAAGGAVAEKTDQNAQATQEDAPISLNMDSPYFPKL